MGCVDGARTATRVSEDSPIDSVPEFKEDDGDWPDMDDYDVIADVAEMASSWKNTPRKGHKLK